jgi:tetratricopeptide (TPR) repeat protein
MKEEMDLRDEAEFESMGTVPVFPPQGSFPLMMNAVAEMPEREAARKTLQDYRKIQDLISCGEQEEAMAALEEFLRSFPDHSAAHDDLGVLSFQKGYKKQAGDHFLKSLEANPKNWNAAKNLADLLFEQGHFEDAFQFYQRVLAESPDDEEALRGVAVVCRETGLEEDAEFFYRRVQEVHSCNSAASTTLGEAEDSPVRRTSTASLSPHDPPFSYSTPARKEKQACLPPSLGLLLLKGEAFFEEEGTEESRWLLEEVVVIHPSPGSFV